MGLYDRDYLRSSSGPRMGGPGGGTGFSWKWTVNSWLIVICVAVFAIDGFLPKVPLETGLYYAKSQDGTWRVETADPTRFGSDRPEDTVLDDTLEAFSIPVLDKDGVPRDETVYGFRVNDPEGHTIAIAQGSKVHLLTSWFHFSTKQVIANAQVWRLVGFQFLHTQDSIYHLLFNMIGLFFFGPLVERALGGKRYLAFYLLCGIFGSLLYLVLNFSGYIASEFFSITHVPGLLFNATGTPLVGASAGVFGVLMAGAYLAPEVRVLIFFLIPMRLFTLAWVLVGISLASILFNLNNAGGEAAHLGGAAAGFYFIRRQEALHGIFDFFGKVDPTSRHFAGRRPGKPGKPGKPEIDQVDRILDKISRKGLKSLSAREKRILERASRNDPGMD